MNFKHILLDKEIKKAIDDWATRKLLVFKELNQGQLPTTENGESTICEFPLRYKTSCTCPYEISESIVMCLDFGYECAGNNKSYFTYRAPTIVDIGNPAVLNKGTFIEILISFSDK